MDIKNPKSVELLPVFMRTDEADKALCTAVDTLIKPVGERVDENRVWDKIDELSSETLDELAWEMNIDWWESSWTIEKKRETIKTAPLVKRKRGTVWAVQKACDDIFDTSKIENWDEYGGKPHHFKVKSEIPPATEEEAEKLKGLISKVKMASAVLDSVEFALSTITNAYTDAVGYGCSVIYSATALN